MPKYKYVDGVKYRVVPQSVLGYALVREGSDNSLPSGGTEGQVLTKASDADFDVEWSTVESGGGEDLRFIIETIPGESPNTIVLADETKAEEYFNNLKSGKIPILSIDMMGKLYATDCTHIASESDETTETFYATLQITTVAGSSGVNQRTIEVMISKTLATSTYECEINIDDKHYPGVG